MIAFLIPLLSQLIAPEAAAPPQASATPTALEVRIECAALSAEERALVEVQVRSSLHGVSDVPGPLVLSCAEASIVGGWLIDGVIQTTRTLTLGPRDDRTEMLLWLASLLLETRAEVEAEAAGREQPAASGTAATAPAITASAPSESGTIEAPRSEPIASGNAGNAAATGNAAAPSGVQSHPPALAPVAPTAPRTERPWGSTISIDLGVRYAHFDSAQAGVVGPRLLGEWRASSGFGVAAAAGVLFGVEQPVALTTLEGAFLLGAVWTPTTWMRLLVGPSASWVRVSEPSSGLERDSFTAGVEASVQAMWPKGTWGAFSEIGVRGLVDERRVILQPPDGPSLTFVPHWQALFTLGLRYSVGLRTGE